MRIFVRNTINKIVKCLVIIIIFFNAGLAFSSSQEIVSYENGCSESSLKKANQEFFDKYVAEFPRELLKENSKKIVNEILSTKEKSEKKTNICEFVKYVYDKSLGSYDSDVHRSPVFPLSYYEANIFEYGFYEKYYKGEYKMDEKDLRIFKKQILKSHFEWLQDMNKKIPSLSDEYWNEIYRDRISLYKRQFKEFGTDFVSIDLNSDGKKELLYQYVAGSFRCVKTDLYSIEDGVITSYLPFTVGYDDTSACQRKIVYLLFEDKIYPLIEKWGVVKNKSEIAEVRVFEIKNKFDGDSLEPICNIDWGD